MDLGDEGLEFRKESESEELRAEFEGLYRAIMRSITNSKEVREIIDRIYQLGLAKPGLLLNLSTNVRELIEQMSNGSARTAGSNGKNYKKTRQMIDGRELTPNEVEFESYFSERFDEEKWLRANGLKYEQDI